MSYPGQTEHSAQIERNVQATYVVLGALGAIIWILAIIFA